MLDGVITNRCFDCTVYPEFSCIRMIYLRGLYYSGASNSHRTNYSRHHLISIFTSAFLVNMNVIAGHASVPTKNGSSSIIVLNACSQDPPWFVSCIIGFGDVKLYRSAILNYAEKSYFLHAKTVNGLHVTIFKHINVQDPGTVIITKKLGDGNHCFAVSGKYLNPEISNCLNGSNSSPPREFRCPSTERQLVIENWSNVIYHQYIAGVQFTNEDGQSEFEDFYVQEKFERTFTVGADRAPTLQIFKIKSKYETTMEAISDEYQLGKTDTCIELTGSFEEPIVSFMACEALDVLSNMTNSMVRRPSQEDKRARRQYDQTNTTRGEHPSIARMSQRKKP